MMFKRNKLSLLLLHSKQIVVFSILFITLILCLILGLLIDTQVRHVHISSVYYVNDVTSDGESTKAVRMLALGENSIKNLPLWCDLNGRIVKASVKHTGGPIQCKFATYIIDCQTDIEPTSFTLITPNRARHQLQVTAPDLKPRKLVVCFARMFLYEKWQIALASLEIYKLHGVDLMVIPISSVIEKLHRILKAYEKEGTVRLKSAVHIPKFPDFEYDPNTESEWFQQVTAYTECLYDYRESADFILSVDVDDLIIPKHFDYLHEELNLLAGLFPTAASFEFLWSTTQARGSNFPDKFSINRMIRESNMHDLETYGKSAIRPKRVNQAYVHHPSGNEPLHGFEHRVLTRNDALAVHFRSFVNDDAPIQNTDSYFSNRSIYSGIDNKFKQFLDRNPVAKEAYSQLSGRYHYLDSMLNCYLNIGSRITTNKLDYCPNPLKCMPTASEEMPECVVLKQDYQQTRMSSYLYISSPISSQLDLRVNCLF